MAKIDISFSKLPGDIVRAGCALRQHVSQTFSEHVHNHPGCITHTVPVIDVDIYAAVSKTDLQRSLCHILPKSALILVAIVRGGQRQEGIVQEGALGRFEAIIPRGKMIPRMERIVQGRGWVRAEPENIGSLFGSRGIT